MLKGLSIKKERGIENKKKLVASVKFLLKEYNYDTLTIRNLCKASGVSYGSFYNLFGSKEKFLVYYLTTDFVEYQKEYYRDVLDFDQLKPFDKIIDIFKCCGRYNEDRGIDYIRGFYSPKNFSLYPEIQNSEETYCSFTPLLKETWRYLEEAVDKGYLSPKMDKKKIAQRFCILFNGVTYNWCISNGKFKMEEEIDSIFHIYINSFKSFENNTTV